MYFLDPVKIPTLQATSRSLSLSPLFLNEVCHATLTGGKRRERREAALSLSPSLWRRLWLGQSGIDPRATAKDEERDEKICTMSGGREGHTGLFNNAFAKQIRTELRAKGMCSYNDWFKNN